MKRLGLFFLLTAGASGQSFSYFLLSLSYAPDFCAQPGGNKDPRECGAGRRLGFIVHGLWPQDENGRGPERCGSARPVSRGIVESMLSFIPSESLIQHEWTNHGTCSGMAVGEYFSAVQKTRESVKIPADLDQPSKALRLSPQDVESRMAAANPQFPKGAFRVSCYRDGEVQEVRVCFEKSLKPRACTQSAGECKMGTVTLLPVK